MPFDRAIVSNPASYRLAPIFGDPTIFHATGEETGGAIGIWESTIPPGRGVGPHRHTREDEVFYVLEGTFRFHCGEDTVDLGAGGCVALPRNVRHWWTNIGATDGRLLSIVTPGGFERLFAEAERLGLRPPEDAERLAQLEFEFGVVESAFLPQV